MVKFDAKPSIPTPKPPALFGAGEEPSVAKQEVKKEEKLSFAKAILDSHNNKPQLDFSSAKLGVAPIKKDKKESADVHSDSASELPSTAELLARLNKPGHTPDHWAKKFPPGLAKFFEDTAKHVHHFVAAAAVAAEASVEEAEDKEDAPVETPESTTTDAPVASIAVGEPAPAVVTQAETTEVSEPKPEVVEEPVVSETASDAEKPAEEPTA